VFTIYKLFIRFFSHFLHNGESTSVHNESSMCNLYNFIPVLMSQLDGLSYIKLQYWICIEILKACHLCFIVHICLAIGI